MNIKTLLAYVQSQSGSKAQSSLLATPRHMSATSGILRLCLVCCSGPATRMCVYVVVLCALIDVLLVDTINPD